MMLTKGTLHFNVFLRTRIVIIYPFYLNVIQPELNKYTGRHFANTKSLLKDYLHYILDYI